MWLRADVLNVSKKVTKKDCCRSLKAVDNQHTRIIKKIMIVWNPEIKWSQTFNKAEISLKHILSFSTLDKKLHPFLEIHLWPLTKAIFKVQNFYITSFSALFSRLTIKVTENPALTGKPKSENSSTSEFMNFYIVRARWSPAKRYIQVCSSTVCLLNHKSYFFSAKNHHGA